MNFTLLKSQLQKHEGLRLIPYTDTLGNLTIGVGRNLSKPLSKSCWMLMLSEDIEEAYAGVEKLPWFIVLSDVRQRVVVDMVFNMGLQKFLTFKNLIQAIKTSNFEMAAFEMLNSQWAKQVGQRAKTLATMMLSGADPADA